MQTFDHVSPTDMSQFLYYCPEQWSFGKQGVVGLPVDDTPLLLGTAVHNAIVDYFATIPTKPTPVEIDNQVRQSFSFVFDEFKAQRIKVQRLLDNFVKVEQSRLKTFRTFKPALVEKRLSYDIFVGIVDAYFQDDAVCMDWKTGVGSDTLSNAYLLQGSTYRFLLTKSGYSCKKVLVVALGGGKVYEVPQTSDGWLYGEVDKFRNGNVYPKKGPWCADCSFNVRCQFKEVGLGMWDI